jgi:2-methylcitrate dehydratase PrpD
VTTAEDELAHFVADLSFAEIPADVAERVTITTLDALACAFAGTNAEHAAEVRTAARALAGGGNATVIGGSSLAPLGAALVNGFQIAAPTLGDVHRPTLTHVLPEVLPAALAAAQMRPTSGSDFLAGVCAGMEVTVRVAQALDTDEYRARAFHNPGVAGAIGAAVAAARTWRLDGAAVNAAIGHAAGQAGGTLVGMGTDGVKVNQARGAVSGLVGAQLAAAGVTGPTRSLTGERGGLLQAFAGDGSPDRLTDDLGRSWRLLEIGLRRWPGASSLQAVVEAVLALRADRNGTAVDRMLVALPSRAYALHGMAGWESRLSALQSARWTAAVALADGEVWLDQTDARLTDAAVARYASEAVDVVEDTELPSTGARVVAYLHDGTRRTSQVDVPLGDPARPLTRSDVQAKLRRALPAAIADRAERINESVDELAAAPTLERLTSLLEVR